jgi:hypothetical protein
MMLYIIEVFLQKPQYDAKGARLNPPPDQIYLTGMALALLYPLYHDAFQLYKQGLGYLNDKWNYMDMLHLSLGIYNVSL